MRLLTIILLALIKVSCASETEKKSLNSVEEIYGATTAYSKKSSFDVAQGTKKEFNIVVSNSKMIDTLPPTVTSGNIALLVFEGLSEEEKKAYNGISVDLINSKQDSASYFYPSELLESLVTKSGNFKRFSESIVNGNFGKLDALKSDADIPISIGDGVKKTIRNNEMIYGDLLAYQPFGVSEDRDEIGEIYQFQANLVFEKGTIGYFVNIDKAEGKDKVIGFRFFE
ncbi:hypothetical protein [Altibacter sp.]|uniref:hypothetical protein n=1 Tax=Altibacter sp. TaxID=2024823 RepID=UPI000C98D71F|nr:hypothetical protein [Altibacter sp.]MAP55456.1 hypothetical protein [Altibacter sp.]